MQGGASGSVGCSAIHYGYVGSLLFTAHYNVCALFFPLIRIRRPQRQYEACDRLNNNVADQGLLGLLSIWWPGV